ncbi:hypothetical protein EV140_1427 [Microcella alkaliphila]|uniref:DUF917 domain-containing protein n=1 Tax=Microcella alkaliphila TaxID=279828 RepID=A0A4Q7TNJ8_9MICO|nr:DUF917 domain-containing protein [Microcella alkaliphila]RZT60902.1 hypothetical protein EV140_1427 [Microcella alkaliphila]
MRVLSPEDVDRVALGAQFLACSIDPTTMLMYSDMTRMAMTSHTLTLASLDDLAPDDLVVAVGLVSQGLLMAEMPPCGDEMLGCLAAVERAVGRRAAAIFPLAAANLNAIVPMLTALQAGLPVVDADPMGRVFPLISQTTLNAAGVNIGPVALMGANGERILIEVGNARRAEALVRAATEELGGWAASAMYPCTVSQLRDHGVIESVSRMITLGHILESVEPLATKYRKLSDALGTSRVARAQVAYVESSFGPSDVALPAQPSSLTLSDDGNGRIVRIEIQNEILMVLVDGAVAAAVPDIVTLIDPEKASVVSLDDVRVGDVLDVLKTPADPKWYEPEGLALVGPAAFGLSLAETQP